MSEWPAAGIAAVIEERTAVSARQAPEKPAPREAGEPPRHSAPCKAASAGSGAGYRFGKNRGTPVAAHTQFTPWPTKLAVVELGPVRVHVVLAPAVIPALVIA